MSLVEEISQCRFCAESIGFEPRPVLQISPQAEILIVGQAPGRIVHETGVPFNDLSGRRLRQWMGVDEAFFYDAAKVAIVPMSFCFPGTGKSGDLPPCKPCAGIWRERVLASMPKIQLTLVIGIYAQKWHLGEGMKKNLTETVTAWESYGCGVMPLPHPSPRNFHWLKKNPFFERELLPDLRKRVDSIRRGIN